MGIAGKGAKARFFKKKYAGRVIFYDVNRRHAMRSAHEKVNQQPQDTNGPHK
jgi:hypothetical protein